MDNSARLPPVPAFGPAVRPRRAAIVVLEQECPSTTQSLVEALGQEVDHYLLKRQDGVALGAQLEAVRLDRAWELLAIVGPGARCSTADWQRLLGVLADHPDVGLAVAGEGPAALDGCMIVRGAALEAGGGFDPSFRTPAVLDELARCLQRRGWRLAPTPGCTVEKASQQIWEAAAWAAERQAIAALQTGDRCKTEGDLGGAEQAYRRAIQAKGDFVEPILVLGALLAEQRRTGEAVAEIARLVQLDGQSFRAHNQLGLAQYQACDWQGARRSFERALELAPSQVEPLINLSVLEWEQDHAEQAIDYLERAAQLEPDNREVIVNTGLIQAQLGYCEAALELFRGYSQAHPADLEVMELVVELLMQTGQSQEACQVAGRILDRQPGHARALSIVECERG